MSKPFAPMLSANLEDVPLSSIKFPVYVSPKLDGIRAITLNGELVTRNLKGVRNTYIAKDLKGLSLFDGELIVGSPTDSRCMGNTSSGVMAFGGEPDYTYWVFDIPTDDDTPFETRIRMVQDAATITNHPRIKVVPHDIVRNVEELIAYEEERVNEGYEGVMVRSIDGPYKYGRSTLREGYLMKLKRFIDGEAVVIGMQEAEENQNVATKDALGRTKRSTHQENKVGKGMLGGLLVRDPKFGDMTLAPGVMNHLDRLHFFNNPHDIMGRRVHWRAFGYGMKDLPRFPRYYGIREEMV